MPVFTTLRAAARTSTALALGASLALAPLAAEAQQRPAAKPAAPPAAPAAPPPAASAPSVVQVKAEPSQTEWTKVCGKDEAANKEICYTTRDFVSDQGQPVLAVAVYDVKNDPVKIVRFLMPLGLLLGPGIRFGVDSAQPTAGKYAICFPNGCFAEAQVNEATVNTIKKGNTLNVSVQNQVGKEVTFAIPTEGFGKAFDGAPIDPKKLEEQQKALQSELEKRNEELRRRLSGDAPPPAPAPGAEAPKEAPKP